MAWQQLRTIRANEVQSSDSATYILKLPLSNVLHTLYLKAECTNGSTSAQGLDISDVVDEVEIVADGSEVLASLQPREIERWGLLTLGHPIVQQRNEAASAVQMAVYPLFFGRKAYDPEYWLPCSRFSDLELRVTYSPTIAATSFATGTTTFSVHALMSMGGDPGPYRGTFRTRTIYSFTTAASGDEIIDMPRGALWRRILTYCYEAGVADGTDIDHVELTLNNGERRVLDIDWDDLQQLNQEALGLYFQEHWHLFRSDTDTVNTRVGRIVGYSLNVNEDVDITNNTAILDRVDTIAGDRLTLNSSQADLTAGSEDLTAYTTDHDLFLTVAGAGLPYCTLIDFAVGEPETYFDSRVWDQINLILTQGGAGGTARVSLQEVKGY